MNGETQKDLPEEAIVAHLELMPSGKGDRHANLTCHDSARQLNVLAPMPRKVPSSNSRKLVEPGELNVDDVHATGIHAQCVGELTAELAAVIWIEKRTKHQNLVTPSSRGGTDLPFPPRRSTTAPDADHSRVRGYLVPSKDERSCGART